MMSHRFEATLYYTVYSIPSPGLGYGVRPYLRKQPNIKPHENDNSNTKQQQPKQPQILRGARETDQKMEVFATKAADPSWVSKTHNVEE